MTLNMFDTSWKTHFRLIILKNPCGRYRIWTCDFFLVRKAICNLICHTCFPRCKTNSQKDQKAQWIQRISKILIKTFATNLKYHLSVNKTHIYVIKKAASARFELATPGLGNLCSIPWATRPSKNRLLVGYILVYR